MFVFFASQQSCSLSESKICSQSTRRQILAEAFGTECSMISPEEVKRRAPVLNCDDVVGGLWSPHDGQINPVDATMTVAAAAKRRSVVIL